MSVAYIRCLPHQTTCPKLSSLFVLQTILNCTVPHTKHSSTMSFLSVDFVHSLKYIKPLLLVNIFGCSMMYLLSVALSGPYCSTLVKLHHSVPVLLPQLPDLPTFLLSLSSPFPITASVAALLY